MRPSEPRWSLLSKTMKPAICIVVNGVLLPRKYIHEAGHAVTSASLSADPVSLHAQRDLTDEGELADAICTIGWSRSHDEPIKPWFERRIAAIYGGVLAEALFEVGDEAIEKHALRLWECFDQTDNAKLDAITVCEMPLYGIGPEDASAIRKEAWKRARQTVADNKERIARVAIALREAGCLKNAEIRALMDSDTRLAGGQADWTTTDFKLN